MMCLQPWLKNMYFFNWLIQNSVKRNVVCEEALVAYLYRLLTCDMDEISMWPT